MFFDSMSFEFEYIRCGTFLCHPITYRYLVFSNLPVVFVGKEAYTF